MSYDFCLFQPQPGVDLRETVRSLYENETEELNPGPLNPVTEKIKQDLAKALQDLSPGLELFRIDFAEIVRNEQISEEEAKRQYRHLELNTPEKGNGIQITLYDKTADITVPYWHEGVKADEVFTEIWQYLRLLEQQGGFRTYDPQLEKVLVLEQDKDKALSSYKKVMSNLDLSTALANPSPAVRPWWKLW